MDNRKRAYLDQFLTVMCQARQEVIRCIQTSVVRGEMTAVDGQRFLDTHNIKARADEARTPLPARNDEIEPG